MGLEEICGCCYWCCWLTSIIALLFLGIVSAVITGIAAGFYIGFLIVIGPNFHENTDLQKKLDALSMLRGYDNGTFPAEYNTENIVNASHAVIIGGVVIYSIHFIDSIAHAVGSRKRITTLLLPWMVMCIISIVWSLVVVIIDLTLPINVIDPLTPFSSSKPAYFWTEIGFHLASIPFQLYFLYYSRQMLSEIKALHVHASIPHNKSDGDHSGDEMQVLNPEEPKLKLPSDAS